MPGFWKFARAWLLFAFSAFPAIIVGLRRPSGLGVLLPIAAVYLGIVWRITRSSISGSAESLVVPWGGGLLRRTLPSVTSVLISDRHLTWRGVWALRFVSEGRETPVLVVPRLPWDLIKPTPLDRPPSDREWIAHAVPALMAAGIDVTYRRR